MKPNSQVLTLLLISFNKHLFGTCYALGTIGVTEGGSEKQNTDLPSGNSSLKGDINMTTGSKFKR